MNGFVGFGSRMSLRPFRLDCDTAERQVFLRLEPREDGARVNAENLWRPISLSTGTYSVRLTDTSLYKELYHTEEVQVQGLQSTCGRVPPCYVRLLKLLQCKKNDYVEIFGRLLKLSTAFATCPTPSQRECRSAPTEQRSFWTCPRAEAGFVPPWALHSLGFST
jgi:hypothetical protein